MSSYTLPVALSVILHTVLVIAITYGWNAKSENPKVVQPRYIEAKLVEIKPKSIKKQSAKPKPKKIDLTARRKEQERQRAMEKEAKQKRAQEKAKKEKALKEKQQREKLEQEKRVKEQKEKERLQEQQRQEQQKLEEQRRQKELEAAFADELAEEKSLLEEEADEVTAQSYVALIATRIEQNWSRPPSARKGMACELTIQLVPTGRVVNVSISKSSGNSAFDRSAEQAVKKVERFPELQQVSPEVFERYFRQLKLVFNPKDLRL